MRGCAGSPLLGSIHDRISLLSRESELIPGVHCVLPAIRFQENSWDFQLPDVVRPLAKTSVHDITIIARRLGMRWKEFDPVHGIMRAEGNRQISTATTIRSLGIVIQYIDAQSNADGESPKAHTFLHRR